MIKHMRERWGEVGVKEKKIEDLFKHSRSNLKHDLRRVPRHFVSKRHKFCTKCGEHGLNRFYLAPLDSLLSLGIT